MSRRIFKIVFLLMCLFIPSLYSDQSLHKSKLKDSCELSSSINGHETECTGANANSGNYESYSVIKSLEI